MNGLLQRVFVWTVGVVICCCAAAMIGCAKQPQPARSTPDVAIRPLAPQRIAFLTRDGCAATGVMRANVDSALRSLGVTAEYQVIDIGTLPDTDPRSGYPTPTVLYSGRDVFGMPEPPVPHPPAT